MNHSHSQPGRRILDGTVRIVLAEALILPTGLLTVAFLTRRLGPEGYGQFALTATLIAWLGWSFTSMFSRATIKFVGETENWQPVGRTVIRLHLLVGVGAASVLWLLAEPIAKIFDEPALVACLRLFAFDVPLFSLAHAYRNILVGMGSFRQRAVVTTYRYIGRLVLIVLLVELGLSVEGAILGCIGASLVELAVCRFYFRSSPSHTSDFSVRKLFVYAVPLFLSALSLRFFSRLDLLALKALGGTAEQAGVYAAAQNLTIPLHILAFSFSPLLLSTLSRAFRDGNRRVVTELSRDGMRAMVLLLPFAGLVSGASSEIVELIFGAVFLPAAIPLALLIFSSLGLAMISVTTAILIAAGKLGWTLVVTIPLLPLAAASHLLLIPWLGMIGAALATTVWAAVGALVGVLVVDHAAQVLPPAATLGRSVVLCGFTYALAVFWPAPGLLLFLKIPTIGLFIGLCFLMLGEFRNGEISVAWSLLCWRTAPDERPREI